MSLGGVGGGGSVGNATINANQREKIMEALEAAIGDGAISISKAAKLLQQGDAGLIAAMNMPAVKDRMDDVGKSILLGK